MRYYLDEDISLTVAQLLRDHGINAVRVHDVSAQGLSDAEQLDQAASETGVSSPAIGTISSASLSRPSRAVAATPAS